MTENELRAAPPGRPLPITRARGLARQAAEAALQDTHPGKHVAYLDVWTGDEVERKVLVAADDGAEFQRLLEGLDPAVRRTVQLDRVPDPNAPFELPFGR